MDILLFLETIMHFHGYTRYKALHMGRQHWSRSSKQLKDWCTRGLYIYVEKNATKIDLSALCGPTGLFWRERWNKNDDIHYGDADHI
jgi:hypothetical protein